MYQHKINECDCGSGYERFPLVDKDGKTFTYGCINCEEYKLFKFRKDIETQYEQDELY